ncbi:hypothetical protein [Oryzomicrobium terrae]|nr:hypothetical protein [Oryzomicrobium terrae]
MSYNLHTYGAVDQNEKSVTVPPGSSGLTGKIKEALSKSGWKMAVRGGPRVTEGRLGDNTRLEQYDTFHTRYELILKWHQYDTCISNFSPALFYDITLIDNKTNSEVISLDGRGCEYVVVEKFTEAMNGTGQSQ